MIRVEPKLWDRIKAMGKARGMSGQAVAEELLDGRSYEGVEEGLARILRTAQEFCNQNSRALNKAFRDFDQEEGALQNLKGQIDETLDVIDQMGNYDYE